MNTDSTPNIERIVREAADSINELARAAGALPLREQLVTLHAAGKMAGHLLKIAGLDLREATPALGTAEEAQPAPNETTQAADSNRATKETQQIDDTSLHVPVDTSSQHDKSEPPVVKLPVEVVEQEAPTASFGEMLLSVRNSGVTLYRKSRVRLIRGFDFLATQAKPVGIREIAASGVLLEPDEVSIDQAQARSRWVAFRAAIERQGLDRFVLEDGETAARTYGLNRDAVLEEFPDFTFDVESVDAAEHTRPVIAKTATIAGQVTLAAETTVEDAGKLQDERDQPPDADGVDLEAFVVKTRETGLTAAVSSETEEAASAPTEAVEQIQATEDETPAGAVAVVDSEAASTPEDHQAEHVEEPVSQVLAAFQQAIGDERLPEQFMPLTSTGVGYTEDENGKRTYYCANKPQYIHGLAKDTFELLLERPQGEIDFEQLRQKLAEKTGRPIDINPLNRALTDLEHRFGHGGGYYSTIRKVGDVNYRYVGLRGILTEEERGEVQAFLAPRGDKPQSGHTKAPTISKEAPNPGGVPPTRKTDGVQQKKTPQDARIRTASPVPSHTPRTQADQEALRASYGEDGLRLIDHMEANPGKQVRDSTLRKLFPDKSIESSTRLLQETLAAMADSPQYGDRVVALAKDKGYKRLLLVEEDKIEDKLDAVALEMSRLIEKHAAGLPLGAVLQAVQRKHGVRLEFAQIRDALSQLESYYGERFHRVHSDNLGASVVRILSTDELVYTRGRQVR